MKTEAADLEIAAEHRQAPSDPQNIFFGPQDVGWVVNSGRGNTLVVVSATSQPEIQYAM